jgi:hypothetical protein
MKEASWLASEWDKVKRRAWSRGGNYRTGKVCLFKLRALMSE